MAPIPKVVPVSEQISNGLVQLGEAISTGFSWTLSFVSKCSEKVEHGLDAVSEWSADHADYFIPAFYCVYFFIALLLILLTIGVCIRECVIYDPRPLPKKERYLTTKQMWDQAARNLKYEQSKREALAKLPLPPKAYSNNRISKLQNQYELEKCNYFDSLPLGYDEKSMYYKPKGEERQEVPIKYSWQLYAFRREPAPANVVYIFSQKYKRQRKAEKAAAKEKREQETQEAKEKLEEAKLVKEKMRKASKEGAKRIDDAKRARLAAVPLF